MKVVKVNLVVRSYSLNLFNLLFSSYLAKVVNNDKLTVRNNIQFGVLSHWTLLNS